MSNDPQICQNCTGGDVEYTDEMAKSHLVELIDTFDSIITGSDGIDPRSLWRSADTILSVCNMLGRPLCECSDAEAMFMFPRGGQPASVPRQVPKVRRPTTDDLPNSRAGSFWLYRLWAPDSRLLYVGITRNLRARMARHRETYAGDLARVTHEEFFSRHDVLQAERQAIATEFPAFNVAET